MNDKERKGDKIGKKKEAEKEQITVCKRRKKELGDRKTSVWIKSKVG